MPKRKPKGSTRRTSKGRGHKSQGGDSQTRSQESTARPTLLMVGYVEPEQSVNSTSLEFHMTIRTRVSDLKPRQASMLLAVANVKAVTQGVDFTLYMAMEFLYDFLKKSGQDPLHIRDEKIRQTVLLSELILSSVRGEWFNFLEYEELPETVRGKIITSGWLPNERTVKSWSQHWDLEKYLKVQIVPVDTFRRRNRQSAAERYSSYTRGYGQDGDLPAPGKTRPSPELDGEDSERPPPSFTLQEYEQYIDIISSIESAKARRKQDK
jgi:hypothetical protein